MTSPPADRPAQSAASPAPLAAGRVGRAHGLDGSFYVTRPRARLLAVGTEVSVGGLRTTIVRRAGTEQRPIVRLEGVDSRERADALRGGDLTVHGADAPALAQGEWWAHELEGCTVSADGQEVGIVERLLELPSCEALEVALAAGGERVLVPMVKDAIRRIAPEQRRIEIDLDFLGLDAGRDAGAARPEEPGA